MKVLYSFFAILLLLVVSCTSHNREYLEQIDELNNQLDNAISRYNNVDSALIAEIRTTVKSNCIKITNPDDTIITTTFIPYSHIDKSMKQILRMDVRLRKEAKTSKIQLDNLYHDFKKNLTKESLMSDYFAEEKRMVVTLIDRMDYNSMQLVTVTQRFDSLNPIIEVYLKHNN